MVKYELPVPTDAPAGREKVPLTVSSPGLRPTVPILRNRAQRSWLTRAFVRFKNTRCDTTHGSGTYFTFKF
jgi:hypothetical protein